MPLMPINGTDLYVECFGDGAETVFLTHALFFSGRMYEQQIAHLSDRYRCVTVDWRGQGRSAKPLGGYDVDMLARDIMSVADALAVDRFHWIGMSVGGVTGIRNAAQFPGRFLSLAVGGASAEAEPIEKVEKYESLLLDGFAKDPESVADHLMEILYGAPFRNDPRNRTLLEQERRLIISNDGAAVARAAAPILRRVDIRHMLAHVLCPTLVFVGDLDGANPPTKSQTIASGIAAAELAILPDIGHQPNVEMPDGLGRMLRSHVDRHSLTRAA